MIELWYPPTIRRSGRTIVQEETRAQRKRRQQKEACARWRANNPGYASQAAKKRRERVDSYAEVKAWRLANPEKWRAQWMRRSAKLKSSNGLGERGLGT